MIFFATLLGDILPIRLVLLYARKKKTVWKMTSIGHMK